MRMEQREVTKKAMVTEHHLVLSDSELAELRKMLRTLNATVGTQLSSYSIKLMSDIRRGGKI